MCVCAITYSIPKLNLCAGPMSSFSRVPCRLSFRMFSSMTAICNSQGKCKYFVSEGVDRITAPSCLRIAQPCWPETNTCLYSGMSRREAVVKRSRHVSLTQIFKPHVRPYSALDASSAKFDNWIQEKCHFSRAADGPSESLNYHDMLFVHHGDFRLWDRMKCALLSYLPVPCTDDLLTYFHVMQRPCLASHSFPDNTRSVSQKPDKDSSHKPSAKQLHNVQQLMMEEIPGIFARRHEYRIYTKDLVFEDNWNVAKPQKIVGIGRYVIAVLKARFYIHCNYAKVKVTVLNSSVDESLGCVHFHWRISVLAQRIAVMIWKFAPFKFKKTAENNSEFLECHSTFYLNNKGFIYRHVLDRTISDAGESRDVQKEGSATLSVSN